MPVLQFASHQSPGNIWCFHFWWRWDRSGISGGGSLVPLWCSSTSIYVGLLSSLEILFILKASMKAQFFPSNYQFSNEEVGTVAVSTESFNSASSSSLSLSFSPCTMMNQRFGVHFSQLLSFVFAWIVSSVNGSSFTLASAINRHTTIRFHLSLGAQNVPDSGYTFSVSHLT